MTSVKGGEVGIIWRSDVVVGVGASEEEEEEMGALLNIFCVTLSVGERVLVSGTKTGRKEGELVMGRRVVGEGVTTTFFTVGGGVGGGGGGRG